MDALLGLMDQEWMQRMKRAALGVVRLAPKHWRTIRCFVRTRGEGTGRRLAYAISCPDYPDQETDEPGQELHSAVCDLIRYYTQQGEPFAGIRIIVEMQPDGSMKNRFELVPPPEGTWGPHA